MDSSLTLVERLLKTAGVKKLRRGEALRYLVLPGDFDVEHVETYRRVERYTMTRPERVHALIEAVKYLVRADVQGDFVECGVWRGGSIMTMALTLKRLNARRDMHLFDTFAGMSAPTDADVSATGKPAAHKFDRTRIGATSSDWCRSTLSEVRRNVTSTGYEEKYFHFHEGMVEATLPDEAPEKIALLRLDTDFYESTRHELVHLYPRLVHGGVLLIDDYGSWQGARKAVDEYVRENDLPILLNRVDFASRIGVKR